MNFFLPFLQQTGSTSLKVHQVDIEVCPIVQLSKQAPLKQLASVVVNRKP
jgi:hypothetical protein